MLAAFEQAGQAQLGIAQHATGLHRAFAQAEFALEHPVVHRGVKISQFQRIELDHQGRRGFLLQQVGKIPASIRLAAQVQAHTVQLDGVHHFLCLQQRQPGQADFGAAQGKQRAVAIRAGIGSTQADLINLDAGTGKHRRRNLPDTQSAAISLQGIGQLHAHLFRVEAGVKNRQGGDEHQHQQGKQHAQHFEAIGSQPEKTRCPFHGAIKLREAAVRQGSKGPRVGQKSGRLAGWSG